METHENKLSLDAQTKRRIELEEVYRNEVKNDLENTKDGSSKNKLWSFLNTSLGIWFLSTCIVGLISFFYSRHQEQVQYAAEEKNNLLKDSLAKIENRNQRVRNNASMVTLLVPYLASKDVRQYKIATSVATYLKSNGELPNEIDSALATLADTTYKANLSEEDRQIARAAAKVLNTPIKPRVYIQIADDGMLSMAQLAQNTIKQAGLLAPGIERVLGKAQLPAITEIRYFNPEEKSEAVNIIKLLQNAGVKVNPVPQANTDSDNRPMHYELWFSK